MRKHENDNGQFIEALRYVCMYIPAVRDFEPWTSAVPQKWPTQNVPTQFQKFHKMLRYGQPNAKAHDYYDLLIPVCIASFSAPTFSESRQNWPCTDKNLIFLAGQPMNSLKLKT